MKIGKPEKWESGKAANESQRDFRPPSRFRDSYGWLYSKIENPNSKMPLTLAATATHHQNPTGNERAIRRVAVPPGLRRTEGWPCHPKLRRTEGWPCHPKLRRTEG